MQRFSNLNCKGWYVFQFFPDYCYSVNLLIFFDEAECCLMRLTFIEFTHVKWFLHTSTFEKVQQFDCCFLDDFVSSFELFAISWDFQRRLFNTWWLIVLVHVDLINRSTSSVAMWASSPLSILSKTHWCYQTVLDFEWRSFRLGKPIPLQTVQGKKSSGCSSRSLHQPWCFCFLIVGCPDAAQRRRG